MWTKNWREKVWAELDQPWDIVIIGGGITGAGILREAARLNLRTLLVDQRDFAWGTSSRSSKFVHGGLRYLKEGQIGLTRDSVHEREQLIAETPGLVEPIGFLLATYKRDKIGRLVYRAGLSIYDLLALQWSHKYYSPGDFQMLAPHIETEGLKGGFKYHDAQTDDARLVFRVIQEGLQQGNGRVQALNYVKATQLLFDENGRVRGLTLCDEESMQTIDVQTQVVINATGVWADKLRQQTGQESALRPLRGSHLIFPGWRLPVAQVITFLHPYDQRPVMIFPWENVTIVGTTDIDHPYDLKNVPCISAHEVAYLMAAVESEFPSMNLTLNDVISTFSGVRAVIDTGKKDPSEESRDHVIWQDSGLLTVTGGKLTTFRLIALEALKAIRPILPDCPKIEDDSKIFEKSSISLSENPLVSSELERRLIGRYGKMATALIDSVQEELLEAIPGTKYIWAELRWAAQAEGVVHLDDLLLRRLRLGLLLPEGAKYHLPKIRQICQPILGWDDRTWHQEEANYLALWQRSYSLPPLNSIPDWRAQLAQHERETAVTMQRPSRLPALGLLLIFIAFSLTLLFLWRRSKKDYS